MSEMEALIAKGKEMGNIYNEIKAILPLVPMLVESIEGDTEQAVLSLVGILRKLLGGIEVTSAKSIATYYKTLIAEGVDHSTARHLTVLRAQSIQNLHNVLQEAVNKTTSA